MPANLDKNVLEDEHHCVRIPYGLDNLDLRMWLVKNGTGLYFNPLSIDALSERKQEWVFSDSSTAMHFKLMFG
jgi:hypothetical protein